jgi:hypothetical protein
MRNDAAVSRPATSDGGGEIGVLRRVLGAAAGWGSTGGGFGSAPDGPPDTLNRYSRVRAAQGRLARAERLQGHLPRESHVGPVTVPVP